MAGRSRMNREVHVRICEGLGVKFPWATRLESMFKCLKFLRYRNNSSLAHQYDEID